MTPGQGTHRIVAMYIFDQFLNIPYLSLDVFPFHHRMPDLNIAREGPAVVSVENELWVIGGKTGPGDEEYQGSVEIFDNECNKWVLHGKDSGLNLKINKNQECQSIVMERHVS